MNAPISRVLPTPVASAKQSDGNSRSKSVTAGNSLRMAAIASALNSLARTEDGLALLEDESMTTRDEHEEPSGLLPYCKDAAQRKGHAEWYFQGFKARLLNLYKELAHHLIRQDVPLVIVDEAHHWRHTHRQDCRSFRTRLAPIARRLLLLSRSLLDFARMMETFDKHRVSFVSVTQLFNTATSMGRLILNVLLSFAQFERELISERTRDKIAATRRKGKWAGGHPILGYDIDPQGFRLRINPEEAERVRAIFQLYLQHESLLPVVQELERRGWLNKRWTTRKGRERGGKPFGRTSLHKLLTNVAYVGRVKYKDENFAGEHAPIVDQETWDKVQVILRHNNRTGGVAVRNRFGFTLKGLIGCAACGCAMTPSHSLRHKTKRYRYYVCTKASKHGWSSCPSPSIPAGQIESFVAEQIREIGSDPALRRETICQIREQQSELLARYNADLRSLGRDLTAWEAEVRRILAQTPAERDCQAAMLAELQDRIGATSRRKTEIQQEKAAATKAKPTQKKLRAKDRPLANDFVTDEAFDTMLDAWFGNMARVLLPGRGFYIWGGYANLGNYPPFLKKHGLYFSQGIVWDKQHPVLTRKDSRGSRVERVGFTWERGQLTSAKEAR